VSVPPADPLTNVRVTNAMHTFRNKPSLVGNAVCDDDGACHYDDILTYDYDSHSWYNMGKILGTRRFPAFIEVPGEVRRDSFSAQFGE